MTTHATPQAHEEVTATLADGIWHIRLQRPAKRNALTMAMFGALAESLQFAEADPAVRALLLSGEGAGFCAGHDLQAFDAWPQSRHDPVPRFLHALADLRKPLVVAAHGGVAGIGVTLLLHADWVLCTPQARLRLPFADLGIGPEAASSLLLAQAVGTMRAKRLLLGSEAFTGTQAHDWGLVSELAPDTTLLDAALARAALLARQHVLATQLKRWGLPDTLVHERIDDEIRFINDRLAQRPHAGATTAAGQP